MIEPEHSKPNEPLPEHGTRCTDVLSDTLQGYAGIEHTEFNLDSGKLNIAYDPRILTREQAIHILKRSGRYATQRVLQCRAKGLSACTSCASQLGEELVQHYQRIADLAVPTTRFLAGGQTGAIEIDLNQPSLISHEKAEIGETFGAQKEAQAREKSGQGRPGVQTWLQGIPREKTEILLTVLTVLFSLAAYASSRLDHEAGPAAILWVLSFIAGGYYGLLDGITALREKRLDVNLLMVLAALGAAAIGAPAEGAALLFLFSLSNTLQSYAMGRSRKAIEKLLDLRPPTANVRRGSRVVNLPVEKLVLSDVVLVRPGERLPIDGEVVAGESDINQAPITGESMPVYKQPGDPAFAGTVNGNGALEIRVTHLAQDTTLARIVQMVEEAKSSKAQTQRMLDDFEQVYAMIVLAGAALLFLVPYFILGHAFQSTFYRAMTWLVVASPCALVISTPASILSAIANGARNGILFKGGVHLEKTATLKVIAFDKTGTLTLGKPRIVTLHALSGQTDESLLRVVAAVESRSEHPLATAIVNAAHQRQIQLPIATDSRTVPGQGVEGRVEIDGHSRVIWVGGRRMFFERGVTVPKDILAQVEALENDGQTVMLAYQAGEKPAWLGLIGATDLLREDARVMIQAIKRHGIQHVVMLTGDNERVAARIAQLSGVDEYHANLLPQDKAALLKTLRVKYGPVAMVGDGVNDAPGLVTADVGIAMGGAGTDVAMETADMVLMSEDLQKLPHALGLARQARRVVWQNLTFSLSVIVLLVITAFGAQLPLPVGVVGHEGSTVLVVLNGLRLLAYK